MTSLGQLVLARFEAILLSETAKQGQVCGDILIQRLPASRQSQEESDIYARGIGSPSRIHPFKSVKTNARLQTPCLDCR